MKTWKIYSLLGLGFVSLLTVGLYFWFQPKPQGPVSIRILQTRSASLTADLQKLFHQLPIARQGLQFEIIYQDKDARPLPDYDGLITDRQTAMLLHESKEIGSAGTPLYEEGYQVLYSNRKLTRTVPKTWEELIGETAAQANQSLNRFGLSMSSEVFAVFPFVSRAFLDEQGQPRQAVQTSFLQEGIAMLKALRYTFSLTPRDCSAECAAQIFLNGQAPYALAGEWRWREFAQKPELDLGIAPLPHLESGPSLGKRSTVVLAVSRSADAARQQAMQDVEASLQSAEGAALIFAQLGKVPSIYLKEGAPTTQPHAQALVKVIQESSMPVDARVYDQMIEALRPPIQDYYQGLLASSETIERLGKVTP